MSAKKADIVPVRPGSAQVKKAGAQSSGRSRPSIIGSDVRITGAILSEGDVHIDGAVDGDVRVGAVVIGRGGSVTGEILAQSVVVEGRVEGVIKAVSVHLAPGSEVEGDIVQSSLTIEPKARFIGQVRRADELKNKASVAVPDREKIATASRQIGS